MPRIADPDRRRRAGGDVLGLFAAAGSRPRVRPARSLALRRPVGRPPDRHARRGARRSHRTATFLFTDIEGSTRLWEEQREAMAVALEAHDSLLRAAVERAGGKRRQDDGRRDAGGLRPTRGGADGCHRRSAGSRRSPVAGDATVAGPDGGPFRERRHAGRRLLRAGPQPGRSSARDRPRRAGAGVGHDGRPGRRRPSSDVRS